MNHSAYTALVRLILECGVVCWGPFTEGQVSALNQVQKRVAKFANNKNALGWETSAQHILITRIRALFKAYTGRWAWKAIGDMTSKAMLPEEGQS